MTEPETQPSKIASRLLHEVDVGDELTVETEYGMKINRTVTDKETERTIHEGELFLGEADGVHLFIFVDKVDFDGTWMIRGQELQDDGMYKSKGDIEKVWFW